MDTLSATACSAEHPCRTLAEALARSDPHSPMWWVLVGTLVVFAVALVGGMGLIGFIADDLLAGWTGRRPCLHCGQGGWPPVISLLLIGGTIAVIAGALTA